MTLDLNKQLLIAITLSFTGSCALSEESNYDVKPLEAQVLRVPGWVHVSFDIDREFIVLNKGKLDASYDEFVGGLLDDGLNIESSYWIKPTYGNENLLWTYDSNIGRKKINALRLSEKEFTSNGYDFLDGNLIVGDKKWNYSGYSIQPTGSNSISFKSYTFVCTAGTGVSETVNKTV